MDSQDLLENIYGMLIENMVAEGFDIVLQPNDIFWIEKDVLRARLSPNNIPKNILFAGFTEESYLTKIKIIFD